MGANQVGLFIGGFPGEEGLWVIKNGVMSELTGITGAVGGTGLFDQTSGDGPDFTQFNASQINGLALFQGFGAAHDIHEFLGDRCLPSLVIVDR